MFAQGLVVSLSKGQHAAVKDLPSELPLTEFELMAANIVVKLSSMINVSSRSIESPVVDLPSQWLLGGSSKHTQDRSKCLLESHFH